MGKWGDGGKVPDPLKHSARVGFALHAGAWVFVQDYLGCERTVFDVIA